MRLLARQPVRGPARRCGTCRQFDDDPRTLEQALPGWATLGSAFGAVRGDDGLCAVHDRHLSARSHCDSHQDRPA